MRKYRFFGALLDHQAAWLNSMAARGWRLVKTGKLSYDFAPCPPSAVTYCVEFVAQKSQQSVADYRAFLEERGYRCWTKNGNLNVSIGHVRYRPWAEKGGRLATNATTFNRELLLVEKGRDGTPFVLHTTGEDRVNYYKPIRNAYFTAAVLFGGLSLLALLLGMMGGWLMAAFGLAFLLPTGAYQREIHKNRRSANLEE